MNIFSDLFTIFSLVFFSPIWVILIWCINPIKERVQKDNFIQFPKAHSHCFSWIEQLMHVILGLIKERTFFSAFLSLGTCFIWANTSCSTSNTAQSFSSDRITFFSCNKTENDLWKKRRLMSDIKIETATFSEVVLKKFRVIFAPWFVFN